MKNVNTEAITIGVMIAAIISVDILLFYNI
jgi:hypothetical protein